MKEQKEIKISTDYIKLEGLLKFSGIAATGTDAKGIIQSGEVDVNGETCTMRGKKLRPGDVVEMGGLRLTVV